MVTAGRTDIGTVVAFAAGLAKINDPWRDLVTWYRDFRVTTSATGSYRGRCKQHQYLEMT